MNWLSTSTTLAFLSALGIIWRGLAILRNAKQDNALKVFGSLTIVLSILGIMVEFLYLSTNIAVGLEFGAILIEGFWTLVLFSIFLYGLIFAAALGLRFAGLKAGWKPAGFGWVLLSTMILWILTAIATRNINRSEPNAPQIYVYHIWWSCLPVYLIIVLINIPLIITNALDQNDRLVVTAAVGYVLIIFALLNIGGPISLIYHQVLLGVLLLCALAYLAYLVTKKNLLKTLLEQSRHFHLTVRHIFFLIPVILIVAGLIALTNDFGIPGPGIGVTMILLGWGILTEFVSGGWIAAIYRSIKEGKRPDFGGNLKRVAGNGAIKKPSRRLERFFRELISLPSGWVAIAKFLFVIVLLVVLNEFTNYGSTIFKPFGSIGIKDPLNLVDSIDKRLISELSLLNQEFQPENILLTGSKDNIKIKYIRASEVSNSIEAILGESDPISLGSVKVPANVLIAPVQELIRPYLEIRVLNGSIFIQDGKYILLGNSTDGGTWRASTPEGDLGQGIQALVEELAFRVLISDKSYQNYGMTDSWEAYKPFRAGMEKMKEYQAKEDYSALSEAIAAFRNSIQEDKDFSLAYYRLGLALQENRQPELAQQAFSKALSLKSDYVPFKLALAYHLFYYDTFSPPVPAILRTASSSENANSDAIRNERLSLARGLWYQIVKLPVAQVTPIDRSSVYNGLCNDTIDQDPYYAAYFYCYKAYTLLERLPRDKQILEEVRDTKAFALNSIGVIIGKMGSSEKKEIKSWFCEEIDSTDWPYHRPYAEASLRYYERALELQPEDPVIRCNAAIFAWLLDHPERMQELSTSSAAHFELGNIYLLSAKECSSPYYKKAFDEFQLAIDYDPMNHKALNQYAYTYWTFRLHCPVHAPDGRGVYDILPIETETKVEAYARTALRLAKIENDKVEKIIYSSTLAEVLLTEARPEATLEAETILQNLLDENFPDNYNFDEVRWELVQASWCSMQLSQNGRPVGELDQKRLKDQAISVLDSIQAHEDFLGNQIFSGPDGKEYLKPSYRLPFCDRSH